MVIALTGRRIDAPESPNPRFPLKNVPLVRERLRHFFSINVVTAFVSSAACGADLLALEEAHGRGIPIRIVLPFHPQRFRETSVADRPGGWCRLYDRIYAEADSRHAVTVLASENEGEAAYLAVNDAILNEAASLACRFRHDVLAVVLWEGAPRGDSDVTEAFRVEAQRRGFPVSELSTADTVSQKINP
jgi:hypothetical protein